jgi:hypothetical protein
MRDNNDRNLHKTAAMEGLEVQMVAPSQDISCTSLKGLCERATFLPDQNDQLSVPRFSTDINNSESGEIVWYNPQPLNPTSWWWPAVFFASWETARQAGPCMTERQCGESQSNPSEDGVVICLGNHKIYNVVLNRAEQCYPFSAEIGAWIPINQGLNGVFELEFQRALREARTAASDTKEKKHSSAPDLNFRESLSKQRRSREGGYVRMNGRVEGRYRPQTTVQLPKNAFTAEAFRGTKKKKFQYEFLQYFDTNEERSQWLTLTKKEFKRYKVEAESIQTATDSLLMMAGNDEPNVPAMLALEYDACDKSDRPKKRVRCATSKTKRNRSTKEVLKNEDSLIQRQVASE